MAKNPLNSRERRGILVVALIAMLTLAGGYFFKHTSERSSQEATLPPAQQKDTIVVLSTTNDGKARKKGNARKAKTAADSTANSGYRSSGGKKGIKSGNARQADRSSRDYLADTVRWKK